MAIQSFHASVARLRVAGGGGSTLVASDNYAWAAPGFNPVSDDADWTIFDGDVVTDGTTLEVVFGDAGSNLAYFDSVTPSLNQRVEVTIIALGSVFPGVAARVQVGGDRYNAVFNGTVWGLYRTVSGVETEVQTGSVAISAGNKVAIEVSGTGSATRISIQADTGSGWTNVATNIDPGAYLAAGCGGIFCYGIGARVDDFKWYNL